MTRTNPFAWSVGPARRKYLYEVAENGDCMVLTEDGEGIAHVHSEVIAQQMVDELNKSEAA